MASSGCKKVALGCLFPCFFLLALVAGGLAAALWLLFPGVLTSQVNQKVTIQDGHATYEQLQNLTLPLWKSFYFFNLTNPKAFEDGEKPILDEVGPYSYREYRTKDLTDPFDDQQKINYTQQKVFYFDQEASGLGRFESDVICTINIPYIAGADKVESSSVEKLFFEGLAYATGAHLYVCHGPTALAWNYTDTFIKRLHTFRQYPRTYVNIQVNNSINDTIPSTIYTGVGNISLIGQYEVWDGRKKDELKVWEYGSVCDKIRGTEGLFFRPNLKEGENLVAFVDDVQRSFDLQYVGKVNHLGLNAFRYVLANYTFYNASVHPPNSCWGLGEDVYPPEGLFYLGPTQNPVIPIYGSNPHFYDADPSLLDCVEGLNPANASNDITMIDVEPITGANIQLQKNLQLNVKVNKYKTMYLKNIKCVGQDNAYYYPVLWLSEHAELTPAFKQYLEDKGLSEVAMFNTLVPALFGALLALGCILLCLSLCTCCCFVRVSRKSLPSTEEERQRLLVNGVNEH